MQTFTYKVLSTIKLNSLILNERDYQNLSTRQLRRIYESYEKKLLSVHDFSWYLHVKLRPHAYFCRLNFIDTVPACTESGATVASPTATCHEHRASITSTIAYFVTEASPESYIVSGSPFYVFGSETGTVGACGANYRLRIIRVLSARCYPNTLRPTCTTSNDRCRSV